MPLSSLTSLEVGQSLVIFDKKTHSEIWGKALATWSLFAYCYSIWPFLHRTQKTTIAWRFTSIYTYMLAHKTVNNYYSYCFSFCERPDQTQQIWVCDLHKSGISLRPDHCCEVNWGIYSLYLYHVSHKLTNGINGIFRHQKWYAAIYIISFGSVLVVILFLWAVFTLTSKVH